VKTTRICSLIAAVSLPVLLGLGCGAGEAHVFEPTQPGGVQKSSPDPRTNQTSGGTTRSDAPEISRSVGETGGVVVFWPRIIPRASDDETKALATMLQERVAALVKQTLPDASVDVRPEPERVCPQQGCKAVTVGVLFTKDKEGCAAFALVSGPGKSDARIVPWAGEASVGQNTVRFREPPEKQVKVSDFVTCSKMKDSLAAREKDIAAALRTAAGK